MTQLDTIARAAAANAIGQYGKSVVYRAMTQGAYNTATGTAPQSSVDTPCRGVVDTQSLRTLGFKFGEGMVQNGDVLVLVAAAALPSTPAPGDRVTIDSFDWTVVANRPTWSGDQIALHELLVRR